MGYILVPVGLLASNPLIVLFFVLVAIYCILAYFLEYLDKKFSLSHRGTSLVTLWLLIIFVFFILVVLFQTAAVIVLFLDILLLPVIFLVAIPPYPEIADLRKNKVAVIRVLLGVAAVILVLYMSLGIMHGFSGDTNTPAGTGFEMRIVDAEGVSSKIMGPEGIRSSATMVKSENGNWSVYLFFTERGETAYQDAVISSGAADYPDDHPISLVVNNETLVTQTLTRDHAALVKTLRMRAVTILIGPGAESQEKAERIVSSLG